MTDAGGPGELPAPGEIPLDELAARAAHGDPESVESLMARVRVVAHRYCRARLATYPGGLHAADDVAQEVCIAVLKALPAYRYEGKGFHAFVHGIGMRKVADAQRAAYRSERPSEALPEQPDGSKDPEWLAVRDSEFAEVADLLDQLPEKLREIVILRVAVGLSAEAAGRTMGMTPGAVRVAQHRALERLRKLKAAHPEASSG